MNIKQLYDQATSTFTYLLWDDATKEAALIDSVKEQVERDIAIIKETGLNLKYLLETHIHADHVTGSGLLRDHFQAKILVHKNSESKCADQLLEEGNQIHLGNDIIDVRYTPGHTNTDISYVINGAVFTGDTLLIRGSGRTDFQSGNPGDAYDSITQKLFTLSDETIVYPGHDYNGRMSSTIGEEKQHNPRIHTGVTREQYIATMNGMDLPKPERIDIAVPGNLSCGTK